MKRKILETINATTLLDTGKTNMNTVSLLKIFTID